MHRHHDHHRQDRTGPRHPHHHPDVERPFDGDAAPTGRRGRRRGGRRDGPFGPFGPGGPEFGRRARPRRGDVRVAVLLLLREEPMHGYHLLTELTERSGGAWRPSPGSIYPMLSLLEDEGLVRSEESDGRRVFHLTEAGRVTADGLAEKATAPWEDVAAESDVALSALRASAHQVLAASAQVAQMGTDAQVAAAKAVLDDARRALYGLLAQSDEPTA